MITDDQVVALFAMANPVPSTALLDPIESVDIDSLRNRSERSRAMSEVETTSAKPEAVGRRSPLVPVLAVVAIAVIALTVLLTRDDGVASPESVANAYMEARENLDAEAAQALFAPDATLSDEGYDLSEMPALFAWYRALNWNWTPGECAQSSSSEHGAVVRCSNEFESDWTRAQEHAPIGASVEIVVKDGVITTLISTLDDEFGDVWGEFFTWIDENHPDDIAQMYGPAGPLLDDDSIALWGQRTAEYVAVEEG